MHVVELLWLSDVVSKLVVSLIAVALLLFELLIRFFFEEVLSF
jgi:hypothetical protein